MKTILCFKSKLGKPGDGGDWDIDSAVGHLFEPGTGRTLCGARIGASITTGGRWEVTECRHMVDCKRCIRMTAPSGDYSEA